MVHNSKQGFVGTTLIDYDTLMQNQTNKLFSVIILAGCLMGLVSPLRERYQDKVNDTEIRALAASNVTTPKVTLLVLDWCSYCKRLESDLTRANVRFERLNVETSARGKRLYRKVGGGGVPVTLIKDNVVRGYQPQVIFNIIKQLSTENSPSAT